MILDQDNYDRVLQTNYFSTFLLTVGLKVGEEKRTYLGSEFFGFISFSKPYLGNGVKLEQRIFKAQVKKK